MATLEDGAHAYAVAHPKPAGLPSWHDECAKLQFEWNASFTPGWKTRGNITTAEHVMVNSSLFFPVSMADIRPGRFVFLALPGTPDGHVGQCVAGEGPTALIFWATDALTEEWEPFLGLGTVPDYIKKKGATFLGVSEDYAGALPNLSAFEEVPTPEDVMAFTLIAANDAPLLNTVVYDGPYGPLILSTVADDALAQKESIADWNGVQLADVETAIKNGGMSSIAVQNAINSILAKQQGIDIKTLAADLAPLIQHDDPAALALAVTTALTPQIAALPASIVKAEATALGNG